MWRSPPRTPQFTIPEMNHDIPPTLVMTALVERMPRNHLARLVITRDAIDGREAQALGIVSMVAPAAKLGDELARMRKTIQRQQRAGAARGEGVPHRLVGNLVRHATRLRRHGQRGGDGGAVSLSVSARALSEGIHTLTGGTQRCVGPIYELYVGRWSRPVADAFLNWIAIPDGKPGSMSAACCMVRRRRRRRSATRRGPSRAEHPPPKTPAAPRATVRIRASWN